jgi:hypothetical protein
VEDQKLAVCDILLTVWDSKWKSVLETRLGGTR